MKKIFRNKNSLEWFFDQPFKAIFVLKYVWLFFKTIRWRSVKMLFISSGKGGVIFKATPKTYFRYRYPGL
jgi:hypothetical protein